MEIKLNFRKLLVSKNALVLILIWLGTAIIDRLWLALDNSVPPWDQSAHLTAALSHWQLWQQPQVLYGEWWQQVWQRSPSYRGPFVYLATVPFFSLFGRGFDQAALVNLLFAAIILIAVYQLGQRLFKPQVGLWAAGLCALFPSFAFIRTDYLLDYGLTATVILTFLFLTLWHQSRESQKSWLWSLGAGVSLGLVFLTKPTGFLFLLVPFLWILLTAIFKRQWQNLLQLAAAIIACWLVSKGWYGANWLTIITSALAANAVGAAEGDPGAGTLAGWLYYLNILPDMISWPLLLSGLASSIFSIVLLILEPKNKSNLLAVANPKSKIQNLSWLLAFCAGSYIFCSLGTNKDARFILPYLPGVALLIAASWHLWRDRYIKYWRWGTAAAAAVLLIWQLFPLPGGEKLASRRLPYLGTAWPLEAVISEVVKTDPYLRFNIGVIPNTVQVNPFSIDYYGNLADFRAYGRQLAATVEQVPQDGRSLVWYITKTGDFGPSTGNDKARDALKTYIEQSQELQLVKNWPLPDSNQLSLYRRQQLPVMVAPASETFNQVKLEAVKVPPQVPPGKPVPVTYEFAGNWQQLQAGLVLLTWQGEAGAWLHDRAIGLGQLYAGLKPPAADAGFRVRENLAMLPPAAISPGKYTLKATYLNRYTGASYDLDVPPVAININPQAAPLPAPELDLISQLYQLGSPFAQGKLDPVFQAVGRLNQYDPLQDYLVQLETAYNYRLKAGEQNLDLAYTLALAQVLQRRVQPVLATFDKITQMDAKNPYAWAYLGFINLYNWHPQAAETALQVAAQLNPNLPELKTLRIVSAALSLNLPLAWERYQATLPAK